MKCFVLPELKKEALMHAAIGQMDMYVRMYNDLKRTAGDNPTIGIILCLKKTRYWLNIPCWRKTNSSLPVNTVCTCPGEEELAQLLEEDMVKYGVKNI